MKNQPEFELQKQVCEYLSIKYPKVLFLSDHRAAFKLTMPQAQRLKKVSKRGFYQPDLLILEAKKGYHGLFLELKAKSPFKKDGTLLKDEHLEDQQITINDLKQRDYQAMFAWGFEQITNILDEYLND